MGYVVTAGWPTDPDNPDMVDAVRKRVRGKRRLLGILSLLLREVRPFFITVIDDEQGPDSTPDPVPIQPKAYALQCSLIGWEDIDGEEE